MYPLQFFHIRYCLKLRESLPPPFSLKQQTPPFSPPHFSARGGVVLRRRPLLPRILFAVHPPPPFLSMATDPLASPPLEAILAVARSPPKRSFWRSKLVSPPPDTCPWVSLHTPEDARKRLDFFQISTHNHPELSPKQRARFAGRLAEHCRWSIDPSLAIRLSPLKCPARVRA